ncbi:uncharacterized protein LOC132057598 [Lycium ferocissimum]|uniref:uncharacterized protein LOC132057598 n=1 Tax=Lycium ferocissimum TaxID=112874 RepID=UPI0028149B32|nr:uncharacterized protein LOC132057598 [Lycium ferocissimum]
MECITSVCYSLVLNRGLTKPFQGRREIKLGDPMSPYFFVIAIEYLQRELNIVAIDKQFKFHPRCKKLGVMHICFADDLLILCKADVYSIKLLQEAFHRFSLASGLQANTDKSSIYMFGVNDSLKLEILNTLGFCEGHLPFKYLGVPLSSKKLTIAECLPLVEKITDRIKCWSAKLLSYAGRLQLIKSVVFGIQNYWAQIFLLPKSEKNCSPRAVGGKNVMNLENWNRTAIVKQLWTIFEKKDCLLVKWVHIYYMKGCIDLHYSKFSY